MSNQNAKFDQNYKRTITAVTDDVLREVRRLLSDPVTGALKVMAVGGGVVPNYADNETVSGVINGVNRTFTLAGSPAPQSSLILILNGAFQVKDVDYTLSGSTITYLTAPALDLAGSAHIAFYRY